MAVLKGVILAVAGSGVVVAVGAAFAVSWYHGERAPVWMLGGCALTLAVLKIGQDG